MARNRDINTKDTSVGATAATTSDTNVQFSERDPDLSKASQACMMKIVDKCDIITTFDGSNYIRNGCSPVCIYVRITDHNIDKLNSRLTECFPTLSSRIVSRNVDTEKDHTTVYYLRGDSLVKGIESVYASGYLEHGTVKPIDTIIYVIKHQAQFYLVIEPGVADNISVLYTPITGVIIKSETFTTAVIGWLRSFLPNNCIFTNTWSGFSNIALDIYNPENDSIVPKRILLEDLVGVSTDTIIVKLTDDNISNINRCFTEAFVITHKLSVADGNEEIRNSVCSSFSVVTDGDGKYYIVFDGRLKDSLELIYDSGIYVSTEQDTLKFTGCSKITQTAYRGCSIQSSVHQGRLNAMISALWHFEVTDIMIENLC